MPFYYPVSDFTDTTLDTLEGPIVIDITNTEAFLVRKDSDGGDVFSVDTTNSGISVTAGTTAATLTLVGATLTSGSLIKCDDADSITTGKLFELASGSTDASARTLVDINNGDGAATGTVLMELTQSSSADIFKITHNTTSLASAASGLLINSTVANTAGSSQGLFDVRMNNTSSTKTNVYLLHAGTGAGTNVHIQTNGTGDGLLLDQNGDGVGLHMTSEATSADLVTIEGASSVEMFSIEFDGDIVLKGGNTNDVNISTGGGDIVFLDSPVMGTIQAPEDAGAVVIMDMPVSATPAAATEMSFSFAIDSNTIFKAYAEADSSGGVQAPSLLMNAARFQGVKGSDVASADEITLGDGNYFDITGTTTINHITKTNWQAGSVVHLQFDASVTVTHNAASPTGTEASILLSGAGNFSATADDTLTLVYDGTTFRELARTVI